MAQTDPKDSVYNTKTLSKWFAIGAILLLIVSVLIVIEDYDRDWKRYARQQHRLTAALATADLNLVQDNLDVKSLEEIETEIEQISNERSDLIGQFDEKISNRENVYFKENQEFQFAKAQLEAELYNLEFSIKKLKPNVESLKKTYQKNQASVQKLFDKVRVAETRLEQARSEKAQFLADQKELSDKLLSLTLERDRLKKVVSLNELNIGNIVRNAPLVDFIAPTVKINQIILPHLKDDYFFNKVPRVDRCMTCHANADKAGYQDMPQPFRSHPSLGLYLTPNSPHPVEKIGCTVCHSGVPQSVDFSLSGHTPRDEVQALEWKEKYNWFFDKHLPTHMIPTAMTEGKCIQCHAKQVHLEGAPTFNTGMRLIERYGCYTCHKFSGHFEQLAKEQKPGPTLKMVASKLDREWVKKFIWDPFTFRKDSLMPRFWKNDNNSDPASIARGLVEVDAIAHVLFEKSKPYEPIKLASQVRGNAERGKELVGAVGCLACHAVDDFPRTNPDAGNWGHKDPRMVMHGPELNQLGSKLSKNRDWLISWLIDPKHYWENAQMPSMKLSQQEAADVADYLLSKRNPEFEALTMLEPSEVIRDNIVLEYFEKQMIRKEAELKMASMSLAEKKVFVGEKLIEHYGCFSCHAIEGYENVPNVGPELTYQGSKDITKFDFANTELHKTRPNWILTKVRNPRIWDVGKNKDFESKLKMPYMGLSHDQAIAITAVVLGHENKNVDDEAIQKIDGRLESVIEGHRQVVRHNCIGCHNFDDASPEKGAWGGDILAHYQDDITSGPPNLNTQGEKTQTDWLYKFLLNPNVNIRPWLKVRMPQFHMSEMESLKYTQYFAKHDRATYPFVIDDTERLSQAQIAMAQKLVEQFACLTCHGERPAGAPVEDAAPHFKNIKDRLRGPWLVDWLKEPEKMMPGTRMPALWPLMDPENPRSTRIGAEGILNGDAEAQIKLLKDYLLQYPGQAVLPSERPKKSSSDSSAR